MEELGKDHHPQLIGVLQLVCVFFFLHAAVSGFFSVNNSFDGVESVIMYPSLVRVAITGQGFIASLLSRSQIIHIDPGIRQTVRYLTDKAWIIWISVIQIQDYPDLIFDHFYTSVLNQFLHSNRFLLLESLIRDLTCSYRLSMYVQHRNS